MKEREKQLRPELYDSARELVEEIEALDDNDTKIGKKRVRKLTLNLEKLGKEYRKISTKV